MTATPRFILHPSSFILQRRFDLLCILALFLLSLVWYAPALFGGKVLLPADIVPLMRPWAAHAGEKYEPYAFAQNQMHGPIFEYYSWRHYARSRILAGEVPLWNPNELSGNVLLANSQSAVLYPPNALLYLFPLHVGINLVTALHTFLTGLFMYLLLRALRLREPAALTGAVTWMFCGLMVAWTEFQTPTAVLTWLPAALLGWELFARTGQWRWTVLGSGTAVAMVLLAGHLHFAFYVLLAFAAYASWRSLTSPGVLKELPRRGAVLAATLALGVTLSMATMLPVLEMARMNFRGKQTNYGASISLRLPPSHLLLGVMPNLFGNPADYVQVAADGTPSSGHAYFGAFDYIEYAHYVSIPALILAVVALLPRRRKRPAEDAPDDAETPGRVYFGGLAALGLLLALGTPVAALFFYGLPGYSQFNATARALCLVCFGLAGLAAFGMDRVLTGRVSPRAAAGSATVIAAIALLAFPGWGLVDRTLFTDHWWPYQIANIRHALSFVALAGAACGALAWGVRSSAAWAPLLQWSLPALALMDLYVLFGSFNPGTDPRMLGFPTATTDFLAQASPARVLSLETPGRGIKGFIVPNYNAVAGFREVQGADSLHTRRYHQLMEAVVKEMDPARETAFPDPNTIRVPSPSHAVLDILNVRYVTTEPGVELPAPFRKVQEAELTIWENAHALGVAWLTNDVIVDESGSPLNELLRTLSHTPDHARLERPIVDLPPSNGEVRLLSFAPHKVAYEATSTDTTLMVASEPYFPGWRATIDGRPADVLIANHVLRAVPVPAGRSRVVFTYEPASYRVGLYLTALASAVAAFLLASALAWSRTRRAGRVLQ
jgi:hypothetical protein